MKNKLILAIDPGDKYVGVCCWYNGQLRNETILIDNMSFDNVLKNIFQVVEDLVSYYDETLEEKIMIIEKYLNYNHKAQIKGYKENKTSHLIGYLQTTATLSWTVVMQTASQAKNWDDERLVRLGFMNKVGNKFWIQGYPTTRHSRDALRHLIYYTNKTFFENCITKEDLIWKD